MDSSHEFARIDSNKKIKGKGRRGEIEIRVHSWLNNDLNL